MQQIQDTFSVSSDVKENSTRCSTFAVECEHWCSTVSVKGLVNGKIEKFEHCSF